MTNCPALSRASSVKLRSATLPPGNACDGADMYVYVTVVKPVTAFAGKSIRELPLLSLAITLPPLLGSIVPVAKPMVNVCTFDVPPPGVGLKTVTLAVPPVATSAAVIAAVSLVLLTNVVVRSAPFHRITEPLIKFVPVTVSVNATPPAFAEAG